MSILDVESGALHRLEHRLNLPALAVGLDRVFRPVGRNDDLQLRFPVVPFDFAARQVARLPVHVENVVEEIRLADLQVIENPRHPHLFPASGIDLQKVFTDADEISYAIIVQPLNPSFTDEFSVGEQTVDGVGAEQADVPLHEVDALLRVGRSSLGQHTEQQRIGNAVVHHGKHEDVDVGSSELPVGAVDGEPVFLFLRQQVENEFRHKVLADRMFRKKSLDSPQTRIGFRWRVKTGRQLAETHRFALHRAIINSDMSLIWARLTFFSKKMFSVSDN